MTKSRYNVPATLESLQYLVSTSSMRKGKKVQGVPQLRHQEEEERDTNQQVQNNKHTKSTQTSSLLYKRDDCNAKQTKKQKDKVQGKT